MFTVYSECDLGSTLISNLFIDKYMKDANDAQLKIYLYLLRMMNAGRTTSIPDMADQFNHTEREVLRSLRYWERRGLIELEYSAAGELMSLHMISPKPEKTGQAYPVPFSSGRDMDEDDESAVGFDPVPRSAPAMPRLKEMAIAAQHAAPAQTLSSSLPEKEKELPAEKRLSSIPTPHRLKPSAAARSARSCCSSSSSISESLSRPAKWNPFTIFPNSSISQMR